MLSGTGNEGMTFFITSTEYLIALKDKGWFDLGFYNEYDWICHEVYDWKHSGILEEASPIQEEILLQREKQ